MMSSSYTTQYGLGFEFIQTLKVDKRKTLTSMHTSEVYSTHTLKMHIQTQRYTQNICIHRDDICGMLLHGCDQWENSTIAKIVGQMMFAQNSDILTQSGPYE